APSETYTIEVKFLPTSTGTKSAELNIPSNDPNENPLTVSLTGLGTMSQPTPMKFGDNYYEFVQVSDPFTGANNSWAKASADAAARVYNGLSGHLATITSQAENDFLFGLVSGIFSGFQGAWLGGKSPEGWLVGPEAGQGFIYTNWGGIEPNNAGYAYMNIGTFAGGTYSGIAAGTWADDSGVQGVPDYPMNPVIGYFVEYEAEKQPEPDISISPTSHDFENGNVGSTKTQTFTVTNTGNADLIIGNLSITGTNAGEFSIQNDNCSGVTIAPSETYTIEVKFLPTSTGTKSAELNIPSNDPNENPLTVSLTGSSEEDLRKKIGCFIGVLGKINEKWGNPHWASTFFKTYF
ncbi:MAG: choice-of-anchor D domain-containing protein, partial [Spirochaetota bacterium]